MNSHRSRDHHIEVLVQISTKLIEDDFVTKLKAVESVEEVQELFLEANSDSFDSYASSHHEVYVEPLSPWAQSLNRMKEHLRFVRRHWVWLLPLSYHLRNSNETNAKPEKRRVLWE